MSTGETLLFVHGWATESSIWEGQVKEFEKTHNIINTNLPGHGGKISWDEPTIRPAVREVLGYINKSAKDSVIGIGWSLGTQALIASAIEDRKRFKALVLVGATPCFVSREDFPFGQPRALVKRMIMDMKNDPADTVKRFYGLNFTDDELRTDEAKNFIERYKYPGPVFCTPEDHPGPPQCTPSFRYEEITTALEALYNIDLRVGLEKIDIPTLVVHGGLDSVCPIGAGRYLAENIKGSRLEVFENTGHALIITQTERFNSLVSDFIKGL